MSEVPDVVQRIEDEDHLTDVTASYEDAVEFFIELAHNRSNPMPIKHATAYVDDNRAGAVIVQFVVDTNHDVLDDDAVVGFEIGATQDALRSIDDGDDEADGEMVELLMSQFDRELRMAEEHLWNMVVNTDQ